MSWIRNIFLIGVSVSITLIVVEISLRALAPLPVGPVHSARGVTNLELHDVEHHFCVGPHQRYAPHPNLKYTETPNQAYFEFRNDQVNFHIYNEFGFRGTFFPASNRRSRVVLGDSFARGSLADETETIPSFLSRWSEEYHYTNLGTGGYGTIQHVLAYKEYGMLLDPDLIILLLYIPNDLTDNVSFRAWQQFQQTDGSAKRPLSLDRLEFFRSLLKPLEIYKRLGVAKERILFRDRYSSDVTEEQQLLFTESLKELNSLVKESDIKLLVFAIPGVSEFATDWTYRKDPVGYANQVRYLLNGLAVENNFFWIDLKPALLLSAKRLSVEVSNLYGFPDRHLNELGYYAVSTIIAHKLLTLGYETLTIEPQIIDRTFFDPVLAECP